MRSAVKKKRYYLHGDKEEGNTGLYYCARCDVFLDEQHFETHDTKGNHERYLLSLAQWTKREKIPPFDWFRPQNATNILATAAVEANVAYQASRSLFHLWIEGQKDRDDPVGDLAGDIWRDRVFPVTAKTRAEIQRYMEMHGAVPEAVKALKQAWSEFKAQAI